MYYFKGFEKEDVQKCINEDFDLHDPQMLPILLKQWEVYTGSAEHISNKRQQFIIWFNGINGILLAALAGSFQLASLWDIERFLPLLILQRILPILGFCIAGIAIIRILVYRKRKRIKFAQIYTLEKHLPLRLYTNEYYLSKQGKKRAKFFRSGTRIEILFPLVFLIIYLATSLWIFLV